MTQQPKQVLHDLQVHQVELEMQNEELRRIQAELDTARARYFDLYDMAPVGYLTLSQKGLILEANLTAATLLSAARGTLAERPLTQFILKEDQDIYYRHRKALIETNLNQACELRMVRVNGSQFWARLESAPAQDTAGHTVLKVILSDVSERRVLQEAQEMRSRLESLGTLAGGIAHDFNNTLTVILGGISMARLSTRPEEIRERLAEAENGCRRASSLARQLLTFARGGQQIRETTFLDEIVRESCAFTLSGSKSSCHFEIAPDLWPAPVDRGQVSQMIQNIVLNADQAMPGGGQITVTLVNVLLAEGKVPPLSAGPYLRLEITDTGTGIPQDIIGRIWDPYFTTRAKGTGLGLSIVASIANQHGGAVKVKSGTDQGTAFTIYLPAEPGKTGLKRFSQTPLPAKPGANKREHVLVMDDQSSVGVTTKRMLEQLGHSADLVPDGEQAIKTFSQALKAGKPYTLVVLDLTIPGGMGGATTLPELLKLDPKLRSIVFSGYSNDPVMMNYREYGFMAAVTKPFRMESFALAIETVNSVSRR
jgi:PAS domain S-box-containing protein